MIMELELNEWKPIPDATGKTIEFDTIEIHGNEAWKYILQIKVAEGISANIKPIIINSSACDKLNDNIFKFKESFTDVHSSQSLSVKIEPQPQYIDEVIKSCELTYRSKESEQ
jgi:hypothetical protein